MGNVKYEKINLQSHESASEASRTSVEITSQKLLEDLQFIIVLPSSFQQNESPETQSSPIHHMHLVGGFNPFGKY